MNDSLTEPIGVDPQTAHKSTHLITAAPQFGALPPLLPAAPTLRPAPPRLQKLWFAICLIYVLDVTHALTKTAFKSCEGGDQGATLSTTVGSAEDCVSLAMAQNPPCTMFMYPSASGVGHAGWGCRCCNAITKDQPNWDMYVVGSPSPPPPSPPPPPDPNSPPRNAAAA